MGRVGGSAVEQAMQDATARSLRALPAAPTTTVRPVGGVVSINAETLLAYNTVNSVVTTSSVTLWLPTITAADIGKVVTVVQAHAGTTTTTTLNAGAATICGSATKTLSGAWGVCQLVVVSETLWVETIKASVTTGTAYGIVASDVSTTSATLVNITGLSFAVSPGTWTFLATLRVGSTALGMKLGYTATATPTVVATCVGNAAGSDTIQSSIITTKDTATTNAFCVTSSSSGWVTISGSVVATVADTIQLRFLAGAITTATVYAGSCVTATKVA